MQSACAGVLAVPPPLSSVGGGTLVTGDFNRDGRPDVGLPIIGANPGLAVLLNTTGNVVVQPALGALTATPSTVFSGNWSTDRYAGHSGGGQYRGEFSVSTNPQNITVRSSLGGVATRAVDSK